jgi:hypothetical protein
VETQSTRLESKLITVEAQNTELYTWNTDLKRRLQHVKSELAKRPCEDAEGCGMYYFLRFRLSSHGGPQGFEQRCTSLQITTTQFRTPKNLVFARRLGDAFHCQSVLHEYFGRVPLHDSYHGAQLELETITCTGYVPSYVYTTCSPPC